MKAPNESGRYARASILLHWLMVLIIAAVYAAIEFREFWPKGSDIREGFKEWHFMLGLSVFGLVWIRIMARLVWPAPAPLADPPWRRLIAALAHFALYLLMIGMPLAGWLVLSAEGKLIPFFGLELPPLIAPNEGLAETVEALHELGGTIGYWLIGLHAAAALFHHYVLKDKLLLRMGSAAPRRATLS
ncbi:cytochrome b [Sphingopyxis flava]|uniref:Cytochrome b561 n=1 Tax=Sphingopyxis flava TaxID=1507287 RepID=A0A1T5C3E5_9SPHN|nr:cytochrome b [Sphingopyxis flava]SKB53921.1 cytochrome b561 [Sphingopyxis flava]